MTRRLLPTLTSVFLALHTVLGCCWHHSHACAQECTAPCSVESADAHVGHCAAECGTASCGEHQHHGRHECQGHRCVFLHLAGRSSHGLSLQSHLAAVSCVSGGERPIQVAGDERYFAIDALMPPLRLHLAHQVLLL
jgi:hypothetical protein